MRTHWKRHVESSAKNRLTDDEVSKYFRADIWLKVIMLLLAYLSMKLTNIDITPYYMSYYRDKYTGLYKFYPLPQDHMKVKLGKPAGTDLCGSADQVERLLFAMVVF